MAVCSRQWTLGIEVVGWDPALHSYCAPSFLRLNVESWASSPLGELGWKSKASCAVLRREARDVWCLPPVWNLRAVIWFHFAISTLVLLPSPVTLSVLSFSACWTFLLNFFQKILQYFLFGDRLFCMAPVLQLGEVSWSVVCAACCHMTLVFAIMHLYNIF